MNVLLVTGIYPPDIGGPATSVSALAAALRAFGHRIVVVTLADSTQPPTADAIPVIRVLRRALGRRLRTVAAIVRAGRRADVIFANGLALETAIANLRLRKPLVMKVVGDMFWERATARGDPVGFESFQHRHDARTRLLRRLRRWWLRRADIVVVPSAYLGAWVRRWGVPDGRVVVIPNAPWKTAVPADAAIPPTRPIGAAFRVVCVGRLIPLKRLEEVMAAVARMPEAALTVIGDGPHRAALVAEARRLGAADRVQFTGALSHPQALAMLAASDVLVLNSAHETFPHVILEAMALGVPVVASPVGGIPEMVVDGDNGLLSGPDHLLIDILRTLASDPALRARLARRGRETVRSRYDPAAIVSTMEKLLRAAASGRAGTALTHRGAVN